MAYPPIAKWSSGVCGCFGHCQICCCTLCCPCVQIGRNIEIITDGHTDCCTAGLLWYIITLATGGLCSCMYTCGFRKQLRGKYQLPEQPCGDFLTHCCCPLCAVCQESRELLNRGWDPARGYVGNMARFQQLGAPGPQSMQRP